MHCVDRKICLLVKQSDRNDAWNELGLTGGLDSQLAVQVWFGVLFCVNMQVSFLSPPFGNAAFYLKSVAPSHITLPQIFRSFLPFIGI